MDSKSLMIGDWIIVKSNGIVPDTNFQVSGIEEDGLFVMGCDNFMGYDDVKPIPLAEEILKANGFTTNRYKRWYRADLYTNGGSPISIDIDPCKGIDTCDEEWQYAEVVFNVEFIHELQHALRLCGLNELADNFKIKAMEG